MQRAGFKSARSSAPRPIYLKPSQLALHTTIQRIDAQRRESGEQQNGSRI